MRAIPSRKKLFKRDQNRRLLVKISLVLIFFLSLTSFKEPAKETSVSEKKVTIEKSTDSFTESKTIANVMGVFTPKAENERGSSEAFPVLYQQWAVIDNKADGYKFAYPLTFEVDYSQGNKIEVSATEHRGMVLIYLKENEVVFREITQGLSEQQIAETKAAAEFIKQSFVRFSPEYLSRPN